MPSKPDPGKLAAYHKQNLQDQLNRLKAIRGHHHEAVHSVIIASTTFVCSVSLFEIVSFDAMLTVYIDLLETDLLSYS